MEALLRKLPRRQQPAVTRYGIAAALVGACFLAAIALDPSTRVTFPLLFAPILLASFIFDRTVGFYTVALGLALLGLTAYLNGVAVDREAALLLPIFSVLGTILAIICDGLRTAWDRALAAERAKGVFLTEANHRLRNTLVTAISMLSLQARGERSPEAKAALDDAVSRIRALVEVQDHLLPIDRGPTVEMSAYIGRLCASLRNNLMGLRSIDIQVDAEPAEARPEQAMTVGLILNELITNALKHAFPDGREGRIRVTFTPGPPMSLSVEDNGVGLPANVRRIGLGSKLLELLVKQLGGTMTTEPAGPGCRVQVTFDSDAGKRKKRRAKAALAPPADTACSVRTQHPPQSPTA